MTTSSRDHIILGAMFRALGASPSGWRVAGAHADPRKDAAVLRRTARQAESACLDFLYLGDWWSTGADLAVRDPYLLARIDPLSAVAYLAGVTRRIGLVATANTTYGDPYAIARAAASADLLSGGRAGLNLVAGAEPRAAGNHGRDEHWGDEHRYDRAEEFLAALRLLWDSWEDDAFVLDRAGGRLIDPARLHPAGFDGAHVRVAGALNVVRPPQGQVPVVHAGASARSIALAGAGADIAVIASEALPDAVRLAASVRSHAVAAGRGATDVRVVAPLLPVVAETTARAQAITDELLLLVPLDDGTDAGLPAGRGIRALSQAVGTALGPQNLDAAVPGRLPARFGDLGRRLVEAVESGTGRRVGDAARPVTYRHLLAAHVAPLPTVVGTASDVADRMEEWFAARAVDGFLVQSAYLGEQFEAFTTLVVPELQRRGLFRTRYEGRTLRDHLGLDRPANVHAVARAQSASEPSAAEVLEGFDAWARLGA